MNIQGFELVNDEKIDRAINGSMSRGGILIGGLAALISQGKLKPEYEQSKEDKEAYEIALIAEYDRLGGLILKNGLKVKSGSFWDLQRKAPRIEPNLKFISEIDGEIVEVDEEEAKAFKLAKEKVSALKAKKIKKSKKLMKDE